MKGLFRNFLINAGALWVTTQIIPGIEISGGPRGFVTGSLAFMAANILLVPLIKILLLPLNLLTLGIFAWLSNVIALYILVAIVPNFRLSPYYFSGMAISGVVIPSLDLSTFQVAVVASFIIGIIIHFMQWLVK